MEEKYIIDTCCRQMVGQAYIHAEDKHANKSCPYDSIESFLENLGCISNIVKGE